MLYEEIDGWRCVVVVSSDSRLHLNQNAVDGVKISDDDINLMRSDVYYNFKVLYIKNHCNTLFVMFY